MNAGALTDLLLGRVVGRPETEGSIQTDLLPENKRAGRAPGDCALFLRGEVAQLAAVAPHGRARSADDGDVFGIEHGHLL